MTTSPYIARLVLAVKNLDSLGARTAITEAEQAGIPIELLLLTIAGTLAEVLDGDFSTGDLHLLLLNHAAEEASDG